MFTSLDHPSELVFVILGVITKTMNQIHAIEYLYLATIASLLFFLLRILLKQYKEKRTTKRRFKRGSKLEKRGRDFLIRQGYKIEHEQYLAHHQFYVNNQKFSIGLIPDYIVSKGGETYIVDVKSGTSAISLKDKSTRRQLLEYDHAIPNDGIFLLDMENEKLKQVTFPSWKTSEAGSLNISTRNHHKKLIAILISIIISLLIVIYTLL